MRTERRPGALVIGAPAKLNLFLEVLGRRADGYHDIATLMVAVGLEDTLEIRPADDGGVTLECDDPRLSTGPDNLVRRAAAALQQYTGCRRGAAIRLRKRIPMAAGLAGGSADAAATLAGLNELWELGLAHGQLASLAGRLGSDVPFFFATPAAWGTGRGEKVIAVRLGRPLWLVLGCPGQGLATGLVYARAQVPKGVQTGQQIREAFAAGDPKQIGGLLHNRLQEAAEDLCPQVAALRRRFESLGLPGVLMTGSGSSVFGLCGDQRQALEAACRLRHGREKGLRVFVVRTCP